jgi:hypothetical protein
MGRCIGGRSMSIIKVCRNYLSMATKVQFLQLQEMLPISLLLICEGCPVQLCHVRNWELPAPYVHGQQRIWCFLYKMANGSCEDLACLVGPEVNQHLPVAPWMVCRQKIIFHCIPVPYITMTLSCVLNHPHLSSYLVGNKWLMYLPTSKGITNVSPPPPSPHPNDIGRVTQVVWVESRRGLALSELAPTLLRW